MSRWDVESGQLEGPGLAAGRCNDKRGPFALDELPEGSLYVADLGFFSLERLCQIKGGQPGQRGKAKRYFVSRYVPQTTLWTRRGHRIELRGILPQQVGERREMGVLLGASARLPVRLIMERVPKEVGDERRQRLRETAQAHGREADTELLALADWTIVLTNVPRRRLTSEQVLVSLRLRGPLERLFRLWKEHAHIDEWQSREAVAHPVRTVCQALCDGDPTVAHPTGLLAGCSSQPGQSGTGGASGGRAHHGGLV